jgi:hypothetical protein
VNILAYPPSFTVGFEEILIVFDILNDAYIYVLWLIHNN